MSFTTPENIIAGEKKAATEMLVSDGKQIILNLPVKTELEHDKIKELGGTFVRKVDSVLSQYSFPSNFSWKPKSDREYILKKDGKFVLSVFLKRTYYDYYGYVHFEE